jgi:nucleoside phosphorylase
MTENPSVVILTALDVEYDEVYAGLYNVRTQVHPAGTYFDVGCIGSTGPLVALTLTGKGNLPAGTLTERAITYFAPIAVIFVGVAGGTPQRCRARGRGRRDPCLRLSRGHQRG